MRALKIAEDAEYAMCFRGWRNAADLHHVRMQKFDGTPDVCIDVCAEYFRQDVDADANARLLFTHHVRARDEAHVTEPRSSIMCLNAFRQSHTSAPIILKSPSSVLIIIILIPNYRMPSISAITNLNPSATSRLLCSVSASWIVVVLWI